MIPNTRTFLFMILEIIILLAPSHLVVAVDGGGENSKASWWIYVVVVVMVAAAATAVTFCCCGCLGRGKCCLEEEDEDEDVEKNSVQEDVIMSQITHNQYANFHNPDERPGGMEDDGHHALEDDVEEGKEVVQYEWSKDDDRIPAPYAL